ncbi:MAG: deoxyribose-phosphate aldolase [Ignisphaera sp.]|uniref:deoxyribose-phosphate aldolase n=1 Tax=Desulfurococcus sp. TaxID=51678 RepID=UPI0031684F43
MFTQFVEKLSVRELAGMIDHTLLKPEADLKLLDKYIEDTRRYGFKLLMIPLSLVEYVREVAGRTIDVGVVVGFPLGNTSTRVKIAEAVEAVEQGASEIDMVMNINLFKSRNYEYVKRDIRGIVEAAKSKGARAVKVIIETGLLSDEEKRKATELVVEAGADFVKTCTGFLGSVATVHDVDILYKAASGKIGVKASGGIRRGLDALALIAAGASRIGTSSGDKIIEDFIRIKEGK